MSAVGNYEVVDQVETLTGTPTWYTVPAPEGKKIFSGSMVEETMVGSVSVSRSYANEDGTAWVFLAYSSPDIDVTFRVVCAEMC